MSSGRSPARPAYSITKPRWLQHLLEGAIIIALGVWTTKAGSAFIKRKEGRKGLAIKARGLAAKALKRQRRSKTTNLDACPKNRAEISMQRRFVAQTPSSWKLGWISSGGKGFED